MNKSTKLNLINGDFNHEEAKDLLTNLYNSKINFLNLKNWSSNERFGQDDEFSKIQIPYLKNELKKLQGLLLEAKLNGKSIKVSTEVNITLSEN